MNPGTSPPGDARVGQPPARRATILLRRQDVEAMLSPRLCIAAIQDAFRRAALGTVPAPAILGMQAGAGSFHVKAGLLETDAPYFAAKVNANFPGNAARSGLPTIQGAVLLFSATDGSLLAVMDSTALTARRTAAATAVAAQHLSRAASSTVLICGCGAQALDQLRALLCVRSPVRFFAHDLLADSAKAFAAAAGQALGVAITAVADFRAAMLESDIVITCTTSKMFFVTPDLVRPGTFIAAIGADHEDKQEISPELLARTKVVTDATQQACRIGDLHHAITGGTMRAEDVHAELGEIVAGLKPGREREDEITIFDSTGTGLQDVAAAIATYGRALERGCGLAHPFAQAKALTAHRLSRKALAITSSETDTVAGEKTNLS